MAQYAKLVSQYHPDGVYSFVVGSADIVANTLYVRDANGLLVQADASSTGPFFVPLTAEKAGYPVSAILVGTGTVVIVASGSIAKDAKLTNAAAGKVATAGTGDEIVGTAWNAAEDGELLSVVTAATVGGIYPTILEAAHGESVEEAWISEEITLATDSATAPSSSTASRSRGSTPPGRSRSPSRSRSSARGRSASSSPTASSGSTRRRT